MTDEQIDRVMFRYFDDRFKNSKLEIKNYKPDDDEKWKGFYVDDLLIIGYPIAEYYDGTWYSNGEYFEGGWDILGIEQYEFHSSMERYLKNKFPKQKIKHIY